MIDETTIASIALARSKLYQEDRMPRLAAVLLAVALLVACNQPAPTAENAGIAAPADNAIARIQALSPGERDATLFRAIRDAGRECQEVTEAVDAGSVEGAPAWAATCDNGTRYIVVITADGTATVASAAGLTGGSRRTG